jgi:hypothetical protein
MIKLEYLPWMMREAKKKAEALGAIKNSITGGKGNIAGYLAEIALNRHLESKNLSCEDGILKYNFDLLKGEKKIEVKCKRRTVDPKPEYEVSIASTSVHQKPDVYAFVSITFKEKRGKGKSATYHGVESIWLCGFMERDEYFEKARYMRKGQIDTSNGFRVHQNMYNLAISELKDEL